jgi:uncharacterized protein YbbK (DUF523 family)
MTRRYDVTVAMEGGSRSRPRVGISSCLLGETVRYDGGHKREAFLVEGLGRQVEWVPVCPEVEMGLGVPRPPMRLVLLGGETRLITPSTGADHTQAMHAWSAQRLDELAADLCGYVLKSRSPSCGLASVPLFDDRGDPAGETRGLFAAALLARFPDLPIEEETALADPARRADFLSRVFALHRAR